MDRQMNRQADRKCLKVVLCQKTSNDIDDPSESRPSKKGRRTPTKDNAYKIKHAGKKTPRTNGLTFNQFLLLE